MDDVQARLNAGEFVVPEDVVRWKGEEFFQKTIQGSRKAKAEAPAKPQAIVAAPQPTTFDTTGRAALPVLCDAADTVTELADIKHAFRDGVRAQRGIDC